jgi:DNA-binding transcriptional LysR family regulator
VVADDVLGCISLAEQGVGICQTYEFIVAERLQRGRLVRLLEDYEGPTALLGHLSATSPAVGGQQGIDRFFDNRPQAALDPSI